MRTARERAVDVLSDDYLDRHILAADIGSIAVAKEQIAALEADGLVIVSRELIERADHRLGTYLSIYEDEEDEAVVIELGYVLGVYPTTPCPACNGTKVDDDDCGCEVCDGMGVMPVEDKDPDSARFDANPTFNRSIPFDVP